MQRFPGFILKTSLPTQPIGKPKGRTSLLGNQVLNHFNMILDNRNGILYLKPNSRIHEPYSDYQSYLKEMSKMQKNNYLLQNFQKLIFRQTIKERSIRFN
jgi:hypothetical protein